MDAAGIINWGSVVGDGARFKDNRAVESGGGIVNLGAMALESSLIADGPAGRRRVHLPLLP